MLQNDPPLALTFDDVLLVPAHSTCLPNEVNIASQLVRDLSVKTPFLAAAMDTVSEAAMAIAMAQNGGLAVIHKNLSATAQAAQVRQVKKAMTGVISDPITMVPDQTLGQARRLMREHRISGVPIVLDGRLVGILTNRDLRFERDTARPIRDVMTSEERLVTCAPGISPERAKDLMQEHKIEKLLVVDDQGLLQGLITIKDIESAMRHPDAARDDQGQLLCAAAVGAGPDGEERVAALLEAGADVIVLDSAHGHSEGILSAARRYRAAWPDVRMVVGNVATAEATRAAIDAGADAVKVGIGPGSICTTRVVAGVGVPQLTAIQQCSAVAAKSGVPIIADGGVKYSGDAAKALAAGASTVMVGSMLAGTDESPGDVVLYQGRRYKVYRGMGSVEAMQAGSSDRYFQDGDEVATAGGKLVPEGIVGRVPYKGPVRDVVFQLIGGLRAAMGYTGCPTIPEFGERAQFVRITSSGLRESHVHDVVITAEAPNYRVS